MVLLLILIFDYFILPHTSIAPCAFVISWWIDHIAGKFLVVCDGRHWYFVWFNHMYYILVIIDACDLWPSGIKLSAHWLLALMGLSVAVSGNVLARLLLWIALLTIILFLSLVIWATLLLWVLIIIIILVCIKTAQIPCCAIEVVWLLFLVVHHLRQTRCISRKLWSLLAL